MSGRSERTSLRGFVLAGLLVAVVAGVVLSNFAAAEPDGLESAVVKTQCLPGGTAGAPEPDACLEEAAGEAVYTAAPLPDYEITWLSGLLGVAVCFALGAGLVALVRRGRRGEDAPRAEAGPASR